MGWTKFKIPGVLVGVKPKFVLMKTTGRSLVVIAGAKTLEEAQERFRVEAEKHFGCTLEQFFQGCADDFNGDYSADDPDHPHYTAKDLMSDGADMYNTISNHGFEIARHNGGDEYIADDATRTL